MNLCMMHLIIAAERTRHAVQNRISNMGGLSPELKLRLGDLLIRPVASFGHQIWGVNFLDISKGVDGNDLERIHLSYLRHVLGVGPLWTTSLSTAHTWAPCVTAGPYRMQ